MAESAERMGFGSSAEVRSLADAFPHIVWLASGDGGLEWFNRRWYDYTGLSHEQTVAQAGAGWTQMIHPDDLGGIMDSWRESLASGKVYDVEARLRGADGVYRWFLTRSAPVLDDAGRPVQWVGTSTDIDDRKRAEAHTRFIANASEALGSSLDIEATLRELTRLAVPEIADFCAVFLSERDGSLRLASIAHEDPAEASFAEQYLNRYPMRERSPSADVARTGKSFLIPVVPEDALERAARDPGHLDDMRRLDVRSVATVALVGRSQIYGILQLVTRRSGRTLSNGDVRIAETLAARAANAIENARLYEQLQFAAKAGEAFAESLSLQTTMQRVLDIVVPAMADWAVVDLFDEHERVVIAAMVHSDPAMDGVVERLVGASTAKPELEPIIAAALRAPHTQINARIDPSVFASMVQPQYRELIVALEPRSSIIVPLRSRGRNLGAIVAYWSTTPHVYGDDDRPMFEEIARRAAVAIENAQLYERERYVAGAFQRAALPISLPVVPGLRFDSVYVAAQNETQIGGDWYDAVRLPDGRIVLSIGDVSGSGLEAAVIMAAMRQVLRGVANVYADPATMIDAADRTLKAEHPERIVTAFAAVFDPIARTLAYANAGHPRPFVRLADGTIDELPASGLPLGLRDRSEAHTTVVPIAEGSLLLLYTDGLTESTRDPLEGEARVRAALADPRIAERDDPAQAVYDTVLSEGAHDDVVLFAARIVGNGANLTRWDFDARDVERGRAVRAEFTALLAQRGVEGDERFAAEVTFGELLGNVVRHAPGPIEIVLEWDPERAPVLHVLDRGPGFVLAPRLPSDVLAERGRGLFIVWSLAEELNVTRRAQGGAHARAVFAVRRPGIRADGA
ncbi:MAG TPA: SpoIIE family protein phosphatase [Candidatus Baltobacteraceae bacterium]|nr:SpoIIE family protein phosphatase [Candidatus Baltobacteraceae bacterium]